MCSHAASNVSMHDDIGSPTGMSFGNTTNVGSFGVAVGPSSVEKRVNHNAAERARRESLNHNFQLLARSIPTLSSARKPSKAIIVQRTREYLNELRNQLEMKRRMEAALRQYIDELKHRFMQMELVFGLAPTVLPEPPTEESLGRVLIPNNEANNIHSSHNGLNGHGNSIIEFNESEMMRHPIKRVQSFVNAGGMPINTQLAVPHVPQQNPYDNSFMGPSSTSSAQHHHIDMMSAQLHHASKGANFKDEDEDLTNNENDSSHPNMLPHGRPIPTATQHQGGQMSIQNLALPMSAGSYSSSIQSYYPPDAYSRPDNFGSHSNYQQTIKDRMWQHANAHQSSSDNSSEMRNELVYGAFMGNNPNMNANGPPFHLSLHRPSRGNHFQHMAPGCSSSLGTEVTFSNDEINRMHMSSSAQFRHTFGSMGQHGNHRGIGVPQTQGHQFVIKDDPQAVIHHDDSNVNASDSSLNESMLTQLIQASGASKT